VRERSTGVTWAWGAIRAAAARMPSIVGNSLVTTASG
jgi:hypothetical protein